MSETDMTEYAELRAALAAGPAIGPYIVDQDNGNGIVVVDGRGNIVAEANYGDVPSEYGPGVTETIIRGVRSTHLYIAAANPTTITALLAERDHLAAENARLREALEKIPKGTPTEGEEIMVNTPYDVFTLPLRPSGLSGGPRFVVHVPGPEQPAVHPAITHCDNCGCDWLDNGLNPIGCPYCKQNAWRAAFVAERATRYREGGMAVEQARIHAETEAAYLQARADLLRDQEGGLSND